MSLGLARGFEPARTVLNMPTDDIGACHSALAEDESLLMDLRDASRILSEAECTLSTEDNAEAAQRIAKEALDLFRKHSESQGVSDAIRILMCALAEFEEREEALQIGEGQLKAAQEAGNVLHQVTVLQSLAEVATFRCGFEGRCRAMKWAEEAIAIAQSEGNKKLEAYAHLALASASIQQGVKAHQRKLYVKATKALKAALKIFDDCEDDDITSRSGQARALHGLSVATGRLEHFRESVAYSREAAAVWQGLGLRKPEALELEFLSRLQLQLGQVKESRKSAEEALKILISLKKATTWQGVAMRTLVKALIRGNKLKEARKLVNRRASVYQEAKDLTGVAATKDAMAEVCMAEGDVEAAAKLVRDAVEIMRGTKMKERLFKKLEATLTAEMANFYLQGSKVEDALETARTACSKFEKLQCEVEMATTISTMIMSHLCTDRLEEALEETKRALAIYVKLGDAKGEGLAWINHCSALTRMGKIDEAYRIAMKARDMFAKEKLLIGEGQALDHLSSLHMTRGEFMKSYNCAKRGKTAFHEAACFKQEALLAWAETEALFAAAQLEEEEKQKLGKKSESSDELDRLQQASESAQDALKLSRATGDEFLLMNALQAVAKTDVMMGRHHTALEAVEEALGYSEKRQLGQEKAILLLLKAQVLVITGYEERGIEVAQEAKTLLEECGPGLEPHIENADDIIEGKYKKQNEEFGVASSAPLPMMPSQMPTFGTGGISGRSAGPFQVAPQAQALAPASTAAQAPAPSKAGPSLEQILEQVTDIAMSLVGDDDIATDTPLMDAGLDSLASVEFQSALTKEFRGVSMPSTMMFDFPTSREIAGFIKDNFRG